MSKTFPAATLTVGASYSAAPTFGDAASASAHWARVERAQLDQRVEYAVAPLASVTNAIGRVFREGAAISARDLSPELDAGNKALHELVAARAVIHRSAEQIAERTFAPGADRTRYQVQLRERGVLTTAANKTLIHHQWVCAADLADEQGNGGEEALQGFVARGLVIDTKARR